MMKRGMMLAAVLATINAAVAPALAQQVGASNFGGRQGFGQFGGQGLADRSDRWRNNQPMEALKTRYTVRTGDIIPALLLTPINSDLPGQITGQVSQNVYDSATGKYLLIPQGSRLIGVYSNDVAYGQERVLFAWQRVIFPDGRALDIGAMPGADGAGVSGVTDTVDHHYFRIFASALLLSSVTAGFKIALPDDTQSTINGRQSRASVAGEALSENLGQTASEMIRRNMNIAPTIRVRSGFRLNVMVVKDLEFPGAYEPEYQ